MTTAPFDTLKFVQRLKAAGIPEAQAEAMSEAFKDAQGEAEFATKADIAEVKRDIESLRLATKADIAELKTELKTDIANVRTEIERMGRVIVMWNVGTLIAVASIVFAIMRYT
jgi:hypothetical protein